MISKNRSTMNARRYAIRIRENCRGLAINRLLFTVDEINGKTIPSAPWGDEIQERAGKNIYSAGNGHENFFGVLDHGCDRSH
jgi:hypothetical protein